MMLILKFFLLIVLILLGIVQAHPKVILGVLRLAFFSFLITIVIESITNSTLRGVKWTLKGVPERESLRASHRMISSFRLICRRRFEGQGLLSRRETWTTLELCHFILRVDLIYLSVLELQERGGARVGLLLNTMLSLCQPRARFLVTLQGFLRIFLSHRLLGLLSVKLRGVYAITSTRNARLKRVLSCASDFVLSLRCFINHPLIIIKHGELMTYVNKMMSNTQNQRRRSPFTSPRNAAIVTQIWVRRQIDCEGKRHPSLSAW